MEGNFERAIPLVLKHEGGFVDHPNDPGGATNKGITLATYSRFLGRDATVDELRNIPESTVKHIYRMNYWHQVKADDLPSGLDYAVFDYGVNSGPGRAVKHLQRVLRVKQDGAIGPITLGAIEKREPAVLINRLSDMRQKFVEGLKHFDTFGRGWTRRIKEVREEALKWARELPEPVTETIVPPPPDIEPPVDSTVAPHSGFNVRPVIAIGAVLSAVLAAAKPIKKGIAWVWEALASGTRRDRFIAVGATMAAFGTILVVLLWAF